MHTSSKVLVFVGFAVDETRIELALFATLVQRLQERLLKALEFVLQFLNDRSELHFNRRLLQLLVLERIFVDHAHQALEVVNVRDVILIP